MPMMPKHFIRCPLPCNCADGFEQEVVERGLRRVFADFSQSFNELGCKIFTDRGDVRLGSHNHSSHCYRRLVHVQTIVAGYLA